MSFAKNSLQEKSEIYYKRAEIYDALSEAEDADNVVFNTLLPHIAGKNVLDLGCGTGKYLRLFAPHARHITGIDAAEAQLAIARRKTAGLDNVTIIHGDAVTAPLPQYDAVIACWMLGTILDEGKRRAVLDRIRKSLTPGGRIFLVENDEGGAFENLRGKGPVTRAYHRWLREAGFDALTRGELHFSFASEREARDVFGAVWGTDVAAKIAGIKVAHRIIIFS